MTLLNIKSLAVVAGLGMLASVQPSYAVLFQSAATTVGGASVNATAQITISGTSVKVVLTDKYTDPASVGSVLNGIKFNVTDATGTSPLTADAANTVDLQGASPVYGTASAATVASEFTLSNVGSLITLSSLGSTGPDYLIIGPAGYTGNSSLRNDPHNPFILETATFYFTLAGKASFSESDITSLTFLFGTSTDSSTSTKTNDIPVVPEPSTVIAGALLLIPLGVQAVRRLRNNKQ